MTETIAAIVGGGIIGLASALILHGLGRVAGISGIVGGLLTGPRDAWRANFVLGLLMGGLGLALLMPQTLEAVSPRPLPIIGLAGLLVGIGTSLGNGCTSGHGICGLGRLSPRSLAATLTFIATGMITAGLVSGIWQ